MRFETIYVGGFGCLRDVTFTLAPGLNVFYGPNEAGKSTLQQAIWALLYGFYKGDRKLARETEFLQRYRPWTGESYAGHLVYSLDGGKSYKVVRNFDDSDLHTSIWEADTGRDITSTFERGKLSRVSFAQEHFGMSEEVFINTCFVRQADLHQLADAAQEITETVVNLSGTGSQDRSVKRALELLDGAFREQVGSARARIKPLPAAQDNLGRLKREKQDIQARRTALEADYERRGQLASRVDEIKRDVARLQYLLAVSQRDRLAKRIQSIETLLTQKRGLDSQIAQLRDVAEFDLGQRDVMPRLYQEWTTSQDALTNATRAVAESQTEMAELKRQRQVLIDELRPLETARDIPLDQEPVVRTLEQRWRSALFEFRGANEVQEKAQARADGLETVRDLARQHIAIVQAGPQAFHDLKLKWETAEAEVATAIQELKTAEAAWQAHSLSIESYEELHSRFSSINFETLSALKERETSLKQLQRLAESQNRPLITWLLTVISCVGFAVGVALVVIGSTGRSPALLLSSVGPLALGIAAGAAAVFRLRRGARVKRLADEATNNLREDLDKTNYRTVEELETAYHTFLETQTPYDHLTREQSTLNSKQETLSKAIAGARLLLGLEPEANVEFVDISDAEQKARELVGQLQELGNRERQRDAANQALQHAKDSLSQVEADLWSTLQVVKIEGSDLARDVGRFYELCENRRHLEKLEADRRTLEARLELHEAKAAAVRSATITLEGAQNQLQRKLRQVGIIEGDPEPAYHIFQARCEQAETLQQLRQQVSGLDREREALLSGQSLDQLQYQHDTLSRGAQARLAANPSFAGLNTDEAPEALQQQVEDIRKEEGRVGTELATIEERIKLAWSGMRSLAEVEEDIQTTQAIVDVLQFHRQALELAIEQLAAAADEHHRNFLPKLNQMVGQSLSQVTGGRYKEIQIDHADLQVRLQVPDLPNPVTPEVLSRGAQEQIYLLLRLGLTELMSSGRERLPLMLDDPLVNYDHDRLLRGLEFLTEIAGHTQVLLFTKDEATHDWFQSRHAGVTSHRLHTL